MNLSDKSQGKAWDFAAMTARRNVVFIDTHFSFPGKATTDYD